MPLETPQSWTRGSQHSPHTGKATAPLHPTKSLKGRWAHRVLQSNSITFLPCSPAMAQVRRDPSHIELLSAYANRTAPSAGPEPLHQTHHTPLPVTPALNSKCTVVKVHQMVMGVPELKGYQWCNMSMVWLPLHKQSPKYLSFLMCLNVSQQHFLAWALWAWALAGVMVFYKDKCHIALTKNNLKDNHLMKTLMI